MIISEKLKELKTIPVLISLENSPEATTLLKRVILVQKGNSS